MLMLQLKNKTCDYYSLNKNIKIKDIIIIIHQLKSIMADNIQIKKLRLKIKQSRINNNDV